MRCVKYQIFGTFGTGTFQQKHCTVENAINFKDFLFKFALSYMTFGVFGLGNQK